MTETSQNGRRKTHTGGRPPFAFRVEVPDDWTVFDTAAESWRRSALALIDGAPGHHRISGAQRSGALAILGDLAETARQVGTCVSAVRFAKDSRGRLFWGTLTLTWYDSAPIEPDTDFLRLVAGDQAREYETELDTALLTRDETVWRSPLPGIMTEGRTYDAQVYLPVPGTTWTALCSGSTGAAAHADLMEKLVCRMATTLVPDLPRKRKPGTPHEPAGSDPAALRSRLRAAARAPR